MVAPPADRPRGPPSDQLPPAGGEPALLRPRKQVPRARQAHGQHEPVDPVPPPAPVRDPHLPVDHRHADRRLLSEPRRLLAHADRRPVPWPAAAVPGAAPDPAIRLHHLPRRLPVRCHLLVHVQGRRRDLHARRHRHAIQRRQGPGRGAHPGPGEPDLPGGPGVDRVAWRLRARRHPAVGPAGHRQDPDRPGRGRRDGTSVRLRRAGGVHRDVLRGRDPQGQGAVPQAAQAVVEVRRRDRLLRRGRLARQPRRTRPAGRGLEHHPCLGGHVGVPWRGIRVGRRKERARARTRHVLDGTPARGHHDGRHGRRRNGHAAGPARRDVRADEATWVREPGRAPPARPQAQTPAEVPDPAHLRHQHAAVPGRGDVAAWAHRPPVQGRIPPGGGTGRDVRLLPRQDPARAQPRAGATSSRRSRRTRRGRRSRTW